MLINAGLPGTWYTLPMRDSITDILLQGTELQWSKWESRSTNSNYRPKGKI